MMMHSPVNARARARAVLCWRSLLGLPAVVGLLLPAVAWATNRLPAQVSWIGNSLPGAKGWVQQDVRAITVTPEGEVFTAVEWDEGGGEFGRYKEGQLLGYARHTHGWGNNGGRSVAVNQRYVFLGMCMGNEGGHLNDPNTWPPKGFGWYGVSRRQRADFTKAAPFPHGKGGKGDTLKNSFLVINQVPEKTNAHLAGLCADEAVLYVSNPWQQRIELWDAETMTLSSHFPVERPGPIALDARHHLWVLQDATATAPARLLRYTTNGVRLPQQVEFSPEAQPSSFCFSPQPPMLWVADSGPDQHLLGYEQYDTRPRLARTFGQKGGIFSGVPGRFGDLRFNRPQAVGADARGNLYIVSNGQTGGGGTVMESYTLAGRLNWRLLGLLFVDGGELDPADDTQLFTKEERLVISHQQPPGSNWSYAAFTVHPFKYPQDPRLHIWSAGAWVRRLQGQRLQFVLDMNSERLQVYRFNAATDGEIAIPAGLFSGRRLRAANGWPPFQPEKGEWIWRDANGNGAFDAGEYFTSGGQDAPAYQGWWVDATGDVWQASETAGIRRFQFQGLDARGVPRWDFEQVSRFEHPRELRQVKRLRYDPATDVMYLGGTTAEHKNQHWKPMGPVICRYDDWSRPTRRLRWQIVAPYALGSQGHSSCEPMGFDVAGDYLFLPYTGASKTLGFSTGHIEIFRAADGQRVGYLEPPPEIGEIGLQDIRECLTARRRASGEYVLILEEDYKAKLVLYRWRP